MSAGPEQLRASTPEEGSLPSYEQLQSRSDGPAGSSWGVFGPDDQSGTANFLTAEGVRNAAALVRRGAVFNLDWPAERFQPPPTPHRKPLQHTVFEYRPYHLDDYVDSYFLQGSSHLDGLRHVAHHEHGHYNGVASDGLAAGTPDLGVNRWTEHGLVGRGVLVDVERHLLGSRGHGLDHEHAEGFGPEVLDAVLSSQGVASRAGDILIVRTGWPAFFDKKASEGVTGLKLSAGLEQSHEMLGWLWDHQVAVVAADNFALEALPPARTSPFVNDDGRGHTDRLMHPSLIALLGMVVGELWSLDGLAADCAADRVYEFMTVLHPLNITGAVGSPANAVAIK